MNAPKKKSSWWKWALGGLIGLFVLAAVFGEEPETGSGDGDGDRASATSTATPEPTPPPLDVLAPDDGDTVRRRSVVVRGTTAPGATVTVDGSSAKVSSRGRFQSRVRLAVGDNDVELTADADGESTEEILTIERRRSAAELAAVRARREAARQAKLAAAQQKLANLRASARTIPYNQLNKNPDRFAGESVTYRGQIFQIREDGDSTTILLSVTDEGYGLWTDNVFVEYDGTIEGAEEDVITIYGKVVDQYSYETQIGGETYVPRIKAQVIDE